MMGWLLKDKVKLFHYTFIKFLSKKGNMIMCAEKIQRFLMAIVLTVAMVLFASNQMLYAMILQTLVVVMVIVWALFDFCPSLWIFAELFGNCPSKTPVE
jgi:hypothetical protein